MKYLALTILSVFVLSVSCKSTESSVSGFSDIPITTPTPDNNKTTTAPTTNTEQPTTEITNTTITTSTLDPNTTTTTNPNTTTSTTPTTPSTSTPSTTSPIPPTTTTQKPLPPPRCSQFSFLSFVGGIVLTIGLAFISALVWKFYKARTERNYHTL